MEAPVGVVELAHALDRVDVDGPADLAERVGGGDELAQLGLGRPLGRDLDGVGLEADAQPVEVDDLGRRERADHRAAVALADDEPLGLEHAQRLAHRRARQAELLGDALLDQPLPGRVAVLDDRGADLRRRRARRRRRRPSCSRHSARRRRRRTRSRGRGSAARSRRARRSRRSGRRGRRTRGAAPPR